MSALAETVPKTPAPSATTTAEPVSTRVRVERKAVERDMGTPRVGGRTGRYGRDGNGGWLSAGARDAFAGGTLRAAGAPGLRAAGLLPSWFRGVPTPVLRPARTGPPDGRHAGQPIG
ncbi:hypothetical protein GCM10010295_23760 [Streptomyces intermedius]